MAAVSEDLEAARSEVSDWWLVSFDRGEPHHVSKWLLGDEDMYARRAVARSRVVSSSTRGGAPNASRQSGWHLAATYSETPPAGLFGPEGRRSQS